MKKSISLSAQFFLFFSFLFFSVSCDKEKEKMVLLPLATSPGATASSNISVRVTLSAAQLIANNSLTAITFDVETFDTDTMHDNATNPSRITVNRAGLYSLEGMVQFFKTSTGYRGCYLYVNGTTLVDFQELQSLSDSGTTVHVSSLYRFNQGDYVELRVYQNNGTDITISKSSYLSMVKLED